MGKRAWAGKRVGKKERGHVGKRVGREEYMGGEEEGGGEVSAWPRVEVAGNEAGNRSGQLGMLKRGWRGTQARARVHAAAGGRSEATRRRRRRRRPRRRQRPPMA